MDDSAELAAAHDALKVLERRTREQRELRNAVLRRALKSGMTWREAQEITGMTPRGIQKSIAG